MKWELSAASSEQANYIMTASRFRLLHGLFPTPSLSPEVVVQVQSQGHFPAAEAHFQSPTLRQTLLLTFLLALIPVSNKMLLNGAVEAESTTLYTSLLLYAPVPASQKP